MILTARDVQIYIRHGCSKAAGGLIPNLQRLIDDTEVAVREAVRL